MSETWPAPGPGTWELDAAHYPASVSQMVKDVMVDSAPAGMREGFDLLGAPLATMDVRFVNGRMYRRLVPLIGGDRSGTPPNFVLWLATRLHPTFRRRAAVAERSLRGRAWLDEHRRWESTWKPDLIRTNRDLGSINERGLTDSELADHLVVVEQHLRTGTALHFRLHASDLGPIGLLLVAAREWGLDERQLMDALAGASPATSAPARRLAELRSELRSVDVDPTSLDEVRAASPAANRMLSDYLDEYGSRLTTGYDIVDRNLAELPDVVLSSIRDARAPVDSDVETMAMARGSDVFAQLRARLDLSQQVEFDQLVDDARLLYGLRDENGPITYEWPAGVLRRSVAEAARRLVAASALERPEHVFDLHHAELISLTRHRVGPSASELVERHAKRMSWCDMNAPLFLGDPPSDPPVDVLPGAMQTMMRVTLAVVALLEAVEHEDRLAGTGIGTTPYTGIARVVLDADDALDRVDPGDVIIARLTVPTYNSVLAIAGAVVTENGGLLCHTAVIARELGIAAVVGVADALTAIPDGCTVTVDPIAGTVRVLANA